METNRKMKAVILAAGESKRMKSATSKIVHKILGKEIINFTLDAVVQAGISEEDIIVVAGANRKQLESAVDRQVVYVEQRERLGTAHALLMAYDTLKGCECDTLVLVGDNPYITTDEIKNLIQFHRQKGAEASLITAQFPDMPPAYGRILRNADDAVMGIVEEIDASEAERQIREVNSSIYLFKNEVVLDLLKLIGNDNRKGEYYLTDIVAILNNRGLRVDGIKASDYRVAIGINDRWDLQQAIRHFNQLRLKSFSVETGVTFIDPNSTFVEYDVQIGKDTTVYPSTYIGKGSRIGSNCQVGPFTYLKNATIADETVIEYQQIVGK